MQHLSLKAAFFAHVYLFDCVTFICPPLAEYISCSCASQGAIDLVQMELQPAADPNVRLLELNPHVDTKLLALDSTEAASETGPGPQALPVQEYSWQDKGSHIHVRVTSTGHVAGGRCPARTCGAVAQGHQGCFPLFHSSTIDIRCLPRRERVLRPVVA